jgi:hypothetical protein
MKDVVVRTIVVLWVGTALARASFRPIQLTAEQFLRKCQPPPCILRFRRIVDGASHVLPLNE